MIPRISRRLFTPGIRRFDFREIVHVNRPMSAVADTPRVPERQSLVAQPRSEEGSTRSNTIRKAGWIPGILYGPGQDSVNVKVEGKEIARHLRSSRDEGFSTFENQTIELVLGDATHLVVPRQLQVHPATDRIMNLNYLVYNTGMQVDVPIKLVNEDLSPAIKRGAYFLQVAYHIRVSALSPNIPAFIEVDLAGAPNKSVIRMDRVRLPDTVELAKSMDKNFTIGTVVGKRLDM